VAIIDHGQIVAEGTPAELKRAISGEVVTVGLVGPNGQPSAAAGAVPPAGDQSGGVTVTATEVLDKEPYVRKVETHDGLLRLYVEHGATAVPQVMRALEGAQLTPDSIEVHRPSLDDVFLAKTGRSLREE
jgi:ABC-2 type transport system ATP-binding protein